MQPLLSLKDSFSIKNTLKLALLLVVAILMSGCSSSDDDPANDDTPAQTNGEVAVIAKAAADFSSGAHATVNTDDHTTLQQDLLPTGSDITLASHGKHFYRINRQNDSIIKFDIAAPDQPIWEFSVLDSGEEGGANPHAMVVLSETKAYVLRWGKNTAWIVNPSATTEAEFKLGEIDLSAYAVDGKTTMTAGTIVDSNLFIVMQRLNAGFVPQTPYVAVIDTATDTEIETGQNQDFNGIELPLENPGTIQSDETGTVYVQGIGKYDPEYTGGIATIDSETFETELLVDDGDETSHPFGQISGMQIISSQVGYLIAYKAWGDNEVRKFNPITGVVGETAIAGIGGVNIGTLAASSDNQLWVGIHAGENSANITLIDSSDDIIIGTPIELALNPIKVVFSQAAE